eukprot:3284076-Pleurochrysis_carterae.AAC.1
MAAVHVAERELQPAAEHAAWLDTVLCAYDCAHQCARRESQRQTLCALADELDAGKKEAVLAAVEEVGRLVRARGWELARAARRTRAHACVLGSQRYRRQGRRLRRRMDHGHLLETARRHVRVYECA